MRAPEVLVEESGHHRGHLLDGPAHGGQRWTAGRRRAGVVETDDGDVVRHPSAPFPQHSARQVRLTGFLIDAGPVNSSTLPELGPTGASANHAW